MQEHSWEYSAASPLASSASQVGLWYQGSRESPNALWWPRLLEGSASDPAVQELGLRHRQKHTQTASLAVASTTGSLCIQDNFPGTTCDPVVTLSPRRIHHSNSEHVGSAQSSLRCSDRHHSKLQGISSVLSVSNPSLLYRCPITT